MMPREHRGFATAVNHVVFGMGNVLGVAIGGFLMTAAFEVHTGLSGVSLTTDNPVGFAGTILLDRGFLNNGYYMQLCVKGLPSCL